MEYHHIEKAVFLNRPNRFIAEVEIDGKKETCHVKNTGRCKELLVPGTTVYTERNNKPERKTALDLITVEKNGNLVNIDSQVPNKAVEEWMRESSFFSEDASIYPERKKGNSRFDFYVEDGDRKVYIEVKGVTLEENGIARFPDAPTLRGVKHVKELGGLAQEGYEAYVIFVIQMKGIRCFTPNYKTHPEFGKELINSEKKGVKILAFDCQITPGSIRVDAPVKVILNEK